MDQVALPLDLNLDLPELSTLMSEYAIPWGIRIAMALLIFIIGRIIVAMVIGFVQRVMNSQKVDPTLVGFVSSIMRWALLLFVIIAALSQLGIDTTSLIALLGAAGLAIGLALQNSLSNFAAGVMLIVFRPFTRGDYIDAGGASGTVDSVSIFTTTLTTPDNKEVIVPNSAIMNGNITNFSARTTRRVDMVFGISYGDDLRQARSILEDIIQSDARVLAEPAPVITVGELADSSVNFLVRPWVNSSDYWAVLWDTTEAVKLRFDEAGISIPFPQVEMHVSNAGNNALSASATVG